MVIALAGAICAGLGCIAGVVVLTAWDDLSAAPFALVLVAVTGLIGGFLGAWFVRRALLKRWPV